MTLREQFEKETGTCVHPSNERGFTKEYVEWLEQQIPIREQQAWDAARHMKSMEDDGEWFKYKTINDWREKR